MVLKVWSGDPQEVPGAPQQNEEQIYHFNPINFVIDGQFDNSHSISSQCIYIDRMFLKYFDIAYLVKYIAFFELC